MIPRTDNSKYAFNRLLSNKLHDAAAAIYDHELFDQSLKTCNIDPYRTIMLSLRWSMNFTETPMVKKIT